MAPNTHRKRLNSEVSWDEGSSHSSSKRHETVSSCEEAVDLLTLGERAQIRVVNKRRDVVEIISAGNPEVFGWDIPKASSSTQGGGVVVVPNKIPDMVQVHTVADSIHWIGETSVSKFSQVIGNRELTRVTILYGFSLAVQDPITHLWVKNPSARVFWDPSVRKAFQTAYKAVTGRAMNSSENPRLIFGIFYENAQTIFQAMHANPVITRQDTPVENVGPIPVEIVDDELILNMDLDLDDGLADWSDLIAV